MNLGEPNLQQNYLRTIKKRARRKITDTKI